VKITVYLTSDDEVDDRSELHTTFEAAVNTGTRYIDKFEHGKRTRVYERIRDEKLPHRYVEPAEYRELGR
jgi:hypothetical protein